jgi:hypothetical protein
VPQLTDEFVLQRFAHLYEQFFDSFEIRVNGEGERYIHAEHSHPRFKRSWVPVKFCGVPVHCAPSEKKASLRTAK